LYHNTIEKFPRPRYGVINLMKTSFGHNLNIRLPYGLNACFIIIAYVLLKCLKLIMKILEVGRLERNFDWGPLTDATININMFCPTK
jgi:hypothetical protein